MASKNVCDYYSPLNRKERANCPNCSHWGGTKCDIEAKVLRNDKTELVHEAFRGGGRSNRITGILR